MPIRKQDAHKALELLEEYHRRLNDPSQKALKLAIERVIKIFKSRLFQALVDIQEYYEHTLLDDSKSMDQKTNETLHVVTKWEKGGASSSRGHQQAQQQPQVQAKPVEPPPDKENVRPPLGEAARQNGAAASPPAPVVAPEGTASPVAPISVQDRTDDIDNELPSPAVAIPPPGDWVYEEVTIDRTASGLGFSIAGGTDNPHVEDDPGVFITRIIAGGASAATGHIFLNDVIVSVNGVDISAVTHAQAVEVLKSAGNQVTLVLRRLRPAPPPETLVRIELIKGSRGLGFSIAGGRGNQHVVGDDSIYITRIIDGGAAAQDGRLAVGDRLLAVNDMDLSCVTHDEAVNILKSIQDRVVVIVAKPAVQMSEVPTPQPTSPVPPAAQISPAQPQQGSTPRGAAVVPSPRYAGNQPAPAKQLSPNGDPSVPRETRTIYLKKSATGFGFNIVGGEHVGSGIYISFILPSGAADVQGELRRGDRILSVNGHDLRNATHEEAASVLKSCLDSANIVVAYCPDDYELFEQKMRAETSGGLDGSMAPAPASPTAPIAGGGDVIVSSLSGPAQATPQLQGSVIAQPQSATSTLSASQTQPSGTLKAAQKREFYVRALFEYDPARDSGLPGKGLAFRHGDVLHVTNAADEEWWQARHVNADGSEEGLGIIPSKRRVEKRERTRMKNVKFRPKTGDQAGAQSKDGKAGKSKLGRFFGKKSKEEAGIDGDVAEAEADSGGEGTTTNKGAAGEDKCLSYELVAQHRVDYARPIVILGPLKDRINDDLISEFPDRFASAVPHTTRPKRDNEVDGRDYYFVSRDQMERDIQEHLFIEAGQYNDNLYGTSVTAVRELADRGKHCVLDVSGNAIRRLQANGLYPIAILLRPVSLEQIREWNKRLTDEQVQKLYDRTAKLENDFGEYFTSVVQASQATIDDIYNRVKDVIAQQSGPIVWIPSKEKLA